MKVTAQTYARIWHDSLKAAPAKDWPAISEAVLRHMLKGGAIKLLPEVLAEVKKLEKPDHLEVTVTSAHELDEKMIQQLVSKLSGSKDATLSYKTDPSLVGGLVIQTQDQRWDLSIKKQLQRLHREISS